MIKEEKKPLLIRRCFFQLCHNRMPNHGLQMTPHIRSNKMSIIISLLAAVAIVTNVFFYIFFTRTIKKYDPLSINNEAKEKIEEVKLWRNRYIKYKVGPQVLLLSILMSSLLIYYFSEDFKKFQIIKNPVLVLSKITNKYTKKHNEKVYYHVEYEYNIDTTTGNNTSYKGKGKISKKDFYAIDDRTLLKITYNQSNPEQAQIGDFSNLTAKRMIINRIIPYSCLLIIYMLILYYTFYVIFKIKVRKIANTKKKNA